MCGIVGVSAGPYMSFPEGSLEGLAVKMSDELVHRGPDASGHWVDEVKGVVLGHRRLAVVDLTAAGSQPMLSSCGRYVLVYNGELYNADTLATKLVKEGIKFKGHSDTEVLIEAISSWGLDETLPQLIGMFAFAVYDRRADELLLVRDRLGIKPLYLGCFGEAVFFASELSALKVVASRSLSIDRDSVAAYLRHNYIPAPASIYKEITKLPPGAVATVRDGKLDNIRRWWRLKDVARAGVEKQFEGTAGDAVDQVGALLKDAVGRRMISDVPLGAFLSGGIDSSLIVALMQEQSRSPINTFSIGFEEQAFDESQFARSVAACLGANHTEFLISSLDAQSLVPGLAACMDEPFGDSSFLPTLIVSKLARKHVTVALSGDGGDELFSGYQRYFQTMDIFNKLSKIPLELHPVIGKLLLKFTGRSNEFGLEGRWRKLAQVLIGGPMQLFQYTVCHVSEPSTLVRGCTQYRSMEEIIADSAFLKNLVDRMRYQDAAGYLSDDILTKVDRASMQVSLEARVPMLDHRVVEKAWTLPQDLLIKGGQSKWILREILKKYVPDFNFERPKMGFGVPLGSWLRGPLREWGEELLDLRCLKQHDLLEPIPVRNMWEQHLSGSDQFQYQLWDILMLQSWLEHQRLGV